MSIDQCREVIAAGMATMVVHVESRITAAVGEAFYTIGPGGEELMACAGVLLRDTDATALHYRHLATQVARALRTKTMDEVLLDRARGHVVSMMDPVGGGVHCSLGGGDYDFVVTSTLASQGPPAVGRAMGAALARHLKVDTPFPQGFVSFVRFSPWILSG
jgi:2-oxoisovalerate dehydrogenase E1 component